MNKLKEIDQEFSKTAGELAAAFTKFKRSKDLEPQFYFKQLMDSLKEKENSFDSGAFAESFREFFPKYLAKFKEESLLSIPYETDEPFFPREAC